MKVLIGAPVREALEMFTYYLESLDKLYNPHNWRIDRLFFLHNSDNLIPMVEGKYFYATLRSDEDYNKDGETHHWNAESVEHVTTMKNFMLDFARNNDYDYFFLVDSDLILHPDTIVRLVEAQKDIVAQVFWTKWSPDSMEAPNAWDCDQYSFATLNRLNEWKVPGLYKIGMSGACILISKTVLQCEKVNYTKVHNISFLGEDRHFCIRAASHDFEIWLDTHNPAKHLYRPEDVEKYRLGRVNCKDFLSGTNERGISS